MQQKLLSQFQNDMQLHGLRPLTQETYERQVRRFMQYVGKPLGKTGLGDVKAYLLHLVIDVNYFCPGKSNCR